MQETNLYTVTIPPMIKALGQLSHILDKAKAHAETKASERLPLEKQMSALLNDRLIFDQFTLIRQIQITTDNAKAAVGRLTGNEVPVFEDKETSLEEIQDRLAKTIDLLKNVKAEDVIGKEETQVTLPYHPGKYFTAFEYVTEFLIPNFYFHYTTAYSIIRKNGVDIGKSDFAGSLPMKNL